MVFQILLSMQHFYSYGWTFVRFLLFVCVCMWTIFETCVGRSNFRIVPKTNGEFVLEEQTEHETQQLYCPQAKQSFETE